MVARTSDEILYSIVAPEKIKERMQQELDVEFWYI